MGEKVLSILCIDDEENILSAMKRLLRREGYRIFTTAHTAEALEILEQNSIQLVISDQRMPQTSGTDFLSFVKERYPEVIRIILTGYTDVDSIAEAVNKGLIYKFILKPWNDEDLKLDIRQALEQYELILTNKRLHEKVIEQNEELRVINENLEEMVWKRTLELEIKNQSLELAQAILEDLPLPIIGVGSDGIVAFINKQTACLPGVWSAAIVGRELGSTFPAEITREILGHLSTIETVQFLRCTIDETLFDMFLSPLSGRFRGRGLVITLRHISTDG